MSESRRIAMRSLDDYTGRCSSCGAAIRWGRTKAGAPMICEPTARIGLDGCISSDETHWAHCKTADRHRRGRKTP